MSRIRLALFGLFVLSGFALAPQTTNAAFITYTETFSGAGVKGTLGGTAFTNATFTLTLTADTSNIFSTPNGGGDTGSTFQVSGTATGSITGFAPFTFTDGFTIFSDTAQFASIIFQDTGFANFSNLNEFAGGSNPALGSYDLSSSISSTGVDITLASITLGTSLGDLRFTAPAGDESATFTAVTGATVPEPSSVVMMGMGAVGVVAFGRRRLLQARH